MKRNGVIRLRDQFTALLVFMVLLPAAALAAEVGQKEGGTRYVLAVSWQSGFCEIRPKRAECKQQTAVRGEGNRFSLHGLWPLKKSYCGIAAELKARDRTSDWIDLPKIDIGADTTARLGEAMPGVVSGLERHQWIRSGSCTGLTPERYFSLSLSLLDRLNASPVRALFAGRIGSAVSQEQVRSAFDAGFGAGAGERVRMRCQMDGNRSVVTGLTIGLSQDVVEDSGTPDLASLILAAGKTPFDCASGIVDAVGLQ